MNSRYSFIVLVVLSCLTSFIAVMVSFRAIDDSQHKWCQIVNTITSIHVPQPEHPEADPSRERAYEFYMEFLDLKRSLGC